MWKYRGQQRPAFADPPGAGQESVWDYPRPPRMAPCDREVKIEHDGLRVARSTATYRVLETASPPTFYVPPQDVNWGTLVAASGASLCEWKGTASYWALASDPGGAAVAWSYARPHAEFAALRDYVAFYPARVACYVDAERVRPQPGGFYGGWVTRAVAGPCKGEPGTEHW